jgi:hypothetical protein
MQVAEDQASLEQDKVLLLMFLLPRKQQTIL